MSLDRTAQDLGDVGLAGRIHAVATGHIIVPADFMGSVYLTGEGCGKYGDSCQSVELTFQAEPTDTVQSYITLTR